MNLLKMTNIGKTICLVVGISMNNFIKVEQDYALNQYDTLSKAIDAGKSNIELKVKSKLINGQVVLGYQFNGTTLSIGFTNDKYLVISPGNYCITWDVVDKAPIIENRPLEQRVIFEFPNNKRAKWEWEEILDSFVGKQVAISSSDQFLFIFSRDSSEFMFESLVDQDNVNFKYLNISES